MGEATRRSRALVAGAAAGPYEDRDEGRELVSDDDLRLNVLETGDRLVVAEVVGELDMSTATAFYVRATALLDDHPDQILDLSGVTFCDSSGFNAVLRLRRRVEETGGWFALAAPPLQIGRLLTLTGAETVFAVYDTRDEAVAAHPGDNTPS